MPSEMLHEWERHFGHPSKTFWPIEDPRCSDGAGNGDLLADWDGAGLGAPAPQCVGASWQILEDGPLGSCGIRV